METLRLTRMAKSLVTFSHYSPESGKLIPVVEVPNLILYGGADVLAKLLAGNPEYKINAMYLEFKNLADPSDPITPPVFDRTGGRDYYDGLVSSLDTDFVRVPLASVPLLQATDTDYSNNQITFFSISSGSVGFHGKTFSSAANSAVYGAALVATPGGSDQAQDVVYARVYSGIDKILKESSREIGVTWVTQFL